MFGDVGDDFYRSQIQESYERHGDSSSAWKAIHGIIDPFQVDLNPYLILANGHTFYDGSLS